MSIVPLAVQSATSVSGSFTASGVSAPIRSHGVLLLHVEGTFSATLKLEFSPDNGVTWYVMRSDADGSQVTFTTPLTTPYFPTAGGVLWRINCTYTSGTVTYLLVAG